MILYPQPRGCGYIGGAPQAKIRDLSPASLRVANPLNYNNRGSGMEEPGQRLKRERERLNLRYRDVEQASQTIANRHENDGFIIALSRLADIENKGTVPSLYRLYSLCAIYRLDLKDVL